jgi:hypothetical protein
MGVWRGPLAGAVGSNYNYSYALSDTVPVGKFWIVLFASSIQLQTSGGALNGLYVINPGQLPAGNLVAYGNNLYFFQGATPVTVSNGPPVGPYAQRVDEIFDVDADAYKNGAEQVCVRNRKLIVPSGCTLMAYGGQNGIGSGGGLNEQFQLQAFYAEFSNDEAQEVVAEVVF